MAWSRKTRQERGYGAAWERVRPVIMSRDKWLCQACLRNKRITPATEVHHVIEKAKGGTDDPTNLEAICRDCHKLATIGERSNKAYRVAEDGTINAFEV